MQKYLFSNLIAYVYNYFIAQKSLRLRFYFAIDRLPHHLPLFTHLSIITGFKLESLCTLAPSSALVQKILRCASENRLFPFLHWISLLSSRYVELEHETALLA